jgi:hypothetical protein
MRIIILTVTKRKIQNQAGGANSKGPFFNLPTPPLMLGGRSHHRSKGQRSIIVDDAISIDIEAKRRWLPNSNLIL